VNHGTAALNPRVRARHGVWRMCDEMKHGQQSAVLALILVACAGCSASPTTPAPAPPLATGTYTLSVLAPDAIFVNDQLVPACRGAGAFAAIVTVATVAADGGVSRVRPMTAADGTFEMELVRHPADSASGTSIAGSIQGVAINTRHVFTSDGAPTDARATFSGIAPASAAQLTGVVRGNRVLTDGTVSGNVVVGDSRGSAVSCAPGTVRWSLTRVP
jgi:hypothetical protein